MKKKLLTLFTLLLCAVGGANAEEAIFCASTMTKQSSGTLGSKADGNVWFGDGTHLASDFVIQITGNLEKGLTGQNPTGGNFSQGTSFKNSNGAQNTITLPTGYTATSVTFYVTTNDDASDATLSEVNGTSYSDKVTSRKNGSSPTVITKSLGAVNSFTFTFSTKQVFFIAVVTYQEPSLETKCATPSYALGAWDSENSKYTVTLSCTTAGSTIKYSTDNKASYSDYTSALALAPGTTLDAYSVKAGLEDSDNMEQYTVPAAPTFYTITYANAAGADGVVPAAQEDIISGSTIILPKNFTMYKDGYTLTGWNDGSSTFVPGSSYTVTASKTLTAVYTENTVSLDGSHAAIEIMFDFRRDNGAPIVQWQNTEDHLWVAQAVVNGSKIDVPMTIITTGGKFNNASNTDCAQVNNGTQFVIPSCKNAKVEMECHGSFTISTTTIDGSTDYTGTGTTQIAYNVASTSDEINVVVGDGSYYKYLKVTLPAVMNTVSEKFWKMEGSGSFESTIVKDDLFYVAAAGKAMTYDKGTTIDGIVFPNRIKFGGSSAETNRHLMFKVAGKSRITVYGQSGKSGELRPIQIGLNSWANDNVASKNVDGADKLIYDYEGTEDAIVFVRSNNNIGILGIKVEPLVVAGTITASGYNTFSSNYPLDLSTISGGTAYVASSVTDGKVVLTKVDDKIVAAGTGLMIAGTAGDPFTIGTTADAATFTGDNLFVGMPSGGEVPVAETGYYNYVFGWTIASDPGFYKVTSDLPTLGAGKAYLHTNSELGATSARLALSFEEGETTGISATLVNSEESTVNNVFDLQGRRVAQPTKGLYIINGRKVVVK